jgi:hypothetical protein
MQRVLVLVEGQTEERFVKDVLQPYLWDRNVHLEPKILTTKRVKRGPDFKGGVTDFAKFERDLKRLLGDTNAGMITTMLDYYGLPDDFPGKDTVVMQPRRERSRYLENALEERVAGGQRFKAYFMTYEFEAFLFVAPAVFARAMNKPNALEAIQEIREAFSTPEDINDGKETHPSKRVKDLFPKYRKGLHGPMVTGRIGLNALRSQCPHFDQWLTRIESVRTA